MIGLAMAAALLISAAAHAESCLRNGMMVPCGKENNDRGPNSGPNGGPRFFGGTTYYGDGASSTRYGDTTYFSDGRWCHTIGGTRFCNPPPGQLR
jgi:hypothetical protein